MTCKTEYCSKPVLARGLCAACYAAFRRAGAPRIYQPKGICSVAGCELETHGGGMCSTHYRRWQRTGDVHRGRQPARPKPPRTPPPPKPSDEEVFWSKVNQTGACWLWIGHVNDSGYGTFRQAIRAHRFAYELLVGPIPVGLDLDHLCRVRHCVNPEHLEAVTRRVNILRGDTVTSRNSAKTHCLRGHEYTPENIIDQRPGRRCRECRNSRRRISRPPLAGRSAS